MGLGERLKQSSPARPAAEPGGASDVAIYHELKSVLHARVVDKLDLEAMSRLGADQLGGEIATVLSQLVADGNLPLNRRERERMVSELLDEILGLGPLETLLRDPSISDILVNTYSTVYVERRGCLELAPLRFRDNDHLLQTINRIVARVGRRVDETSP